MKIIVSTLALLKYLQKLQVPINSFDDDYYDLQVKDKVLTISTDRIYIKFIDVESKENCDCSVSGSTLNKLTSILKLLNDSPITIEINNGLIIREAYI